MKYLSFKILLLTFLLPPICYILTVEGVQSLLEQGRIQGMCRKDVEAAAVGDLTPLLNGSVRLEDQIAENIRGCMKRNPLVRLGVKMRVTVLTRRGVLLFPRVLRLDASDIPADPFRVAEENMKHLEDGLLVKLDPRLAYDSRLSFLFLFLYLGLALAVLTFYYRRGSLRAHREAEKISEEIRRLRSFKKKHKDTLASLDEERDGLSSSLQELQTALEEERVRALRNEDGMVEEIVSLEEKIRENLRLQESQKAEIEDLKEKIDALSREKQRKEGSAGKERQVIRKRLNALYKNVDVQKRAVEGLADLEEDMKIRCEEIIHLLNNDPDKVVIKRKVFGRKGRQTVFEAVFGYKGRLYFQRNREGKVMVLVIGTKNTQQKDLEYVNSL